MPTRSPSTFSPALTATVAACTLALLHCNQDPGKAPVIVQQTGAVVASNGSVQITASDVLGYLEQASRHARRMFATSPAERERVAKQLLREQALFVAARQEGLDRGPEALGRWRKIVVNTYLKQLHSSLLAKQDITDEEVDRYLKDRSPGGPQQEMVRASRLRFRSKGEAAAAKQQLEQGPNRYVRFLRLARKQEGAAGAAIPGDLGFFKRDTDKVPQAVVDAAFSIAELWGLADPVKTPDGWVLVIKTGHRKPRKEHSKSARRLARARLYREKRQALVEQRIAEVVNLDDATVDAEALGRIKPPEQTSGGQHASSRR